jgi:hypothetical protein
VLLSPNRASLGSSSHTTQSGVLSPSHGNLGTGSSGSALYRTNSGGGSAGGSFTPSASPSGYGRTYAGNAGVSYGKGWMTPTPAAEPVASSSSSMGYMGSNGVGGGTATFASTRRSRRY